MLPDEELRRRADVLNTKFNKMCTILLYFLYFKMKITPSYD